MKNIHLNNYTQYEIENIKNKCTALNGAEYTDKDIINISIALLDHITKINHKEFQENEITSHILRILAILLDKKSFATYIEDIPQHLKEADKYLKKLNECERRIKL